MSENPARQRLRITFGKFAAMKYTSNLDVAKIWERVLRRADLPLLYSQGFNTRPRLQLATALPLGITSECELLDVSLRKRIPLDGVAQQLRDVSPDGLETCDVMEVPVSSAALQTRVRSARYVVTFEESVPDLSQRVTDLLARPCILRTIQRKRRTVEKDLRPLIHELRVGDPGVLLMHVAVGDRGNLRPRDILQEMDLLDHWHRVHRRQLVLAEMEELKCN
ncbi:MAG: TIGR03936 family radical SAM-associated protein [Anaerolineaceae bacterium]|nr:TIGR03936 family radical SAM-associated protein [Anaerolineaceae bacterium]